MWLRYFVPCVRNVDGEAGMFDRVTGTFYTNNGTGAFTTDLTPTSLADLKDLVNAGKDASAYLGRYVYADGSIGTDATDAIGRVAHVSPNASTNASSRVEGSRIMVLALTDDGSNVDYGSISLPTEPAVTGAAQSTWMIPTYWEWVDMCKSLGAGDFQAVIDAVGMSTTTRYWTSSTSGGGYGHYYVYYFSEGENKIYSDFGTRTPHPTARAVFGF